VSLAPRVQATRRTGSRTRPCRLWHCCCWRGCTCSCNPTCSGLLSGLLLGLPRAPRACRPR